MLLRNKDNTYAVVKGNIFEQSLNRVNSKKLSTNIGSSVVIPHVCNNVNGFGSGFAGSVAETYPIVKENFHLLGKNAVLGYVQFVVVKEDPSTKNKLVFANMIAQNGIVSYDNPRPLHYPSLVKCMERVKQYCFDLSKINDNNPVEIHAPKFGSGLAGGNWYFISDLINDIWYDLNVYIYDKKPFLRKN